MESKTAHEAELLGKFLSDAAARASRGGVKVEALVAPVVPDRSRRFPLYISDKTRSAFIAGGSLESHELETPSERETYQYDIYITDRDLNKYLSATEKPNRVVLLDERASANVSVVPKGYTEPTAAPLSDAPRQGNTTKTESVVCFMDAPSSITLTPSERKELSRPGEVAQGEIRRNKGAYPTVIPDYVGFYASDFSKARHTGRVPIVCSSFAEGTWRVDLLAAEFLKEYDPLYLEDTKLVGKQATSEMRARERNVELFRPRRTAPTLLRKDAHIILGATPPVWGEHKESRFIHEPGSQRESQCIHESVARLVLSKDPAPYICFVARPGQANDYWRSALEMTDAVHVGKDWVPQAVGEAFGAAAMLAAPSIASHVFGGEAMSAVSNAALGLAISVGNKIAGKVLGRGGEADTGPKLPRARPRAMTGNLPHTAVITCCPMGLVYCADSEVVRLDFFVRPDCDAPEVHNSIWVMQIGVKFHGPQEVSDRSETLISDIQSHIGNRMSGVDRPMLDAMACCEMARQFLRGRRELSAMYGICMQYPVNFVFSG